MLMAVGINLPGIQRLQSCRFATREELGVRMGPVRHSRKYDFAWLHRNGNGRSAVREVPRTERAVAEGEYAWTVVVSEGVSGCCDFPFERCE